MRPSASRATVASPVSFSRSIRTPVRTSHCHCSMPPLGYLRSLLLSESIGLNHRWPCQATAEHPNRTMGFPTFLRHRTKQEQSCRH
jgi:hypothetical protein